MKRFPLAAVALLVLIPSVASASTRQIGYCKAKGDFAVCIADGNANNPHGFRVLVTSSPHQHATGNWTMVCSKGNGAGSKSSDFKGSTPFTRKMKMPYFRPDECTVSALGSLDKGGHLKVVLLVVR